jgi:hypothetical protein
MATRYGARSGDHGGVCAEAFNPKPQGQFRQKLHAPCRLIRVAALGFARGSNSASLRGLATDGQTKRQGEKKWTPTTPPGRSVLHAETHKFTRGREGDRCGLIARNMITMPCGFRCSLQPCVRQTDEANVINATRIRKPISSIHDIRERLPEVAAGYVVFDDDIREELEALRRYISDALAFGKEVAA